MVSKQRTGSPLFKPILLLMAGLVVVALLALKLRRHQTPHLIFSTQEEIRHAVTSLGGSATTPPVIVVRAEWCPACKALEASLTEEKIPFLRADVDEDPTAQAIQRKLWDNGIDTIPQVIVGDKRLPLASATEIRSSLERYLSSKNTP